MKVNDLLKADKAFTPVYEKDGTQFFIPLPDNMFKTEQEARDNAVGSGLRYMVGMGASFTGEIQKLTAQDSKEDINGLMCQRADEVVLICGGDLYERALAWSDNPDTSTDEFKELSSDIEVWLGEA